MSLPSPSFGLISKTWITVVDLLTSTGKKNQALNDICSLARVNMNNLYLIIHNAPKADFAAALAEARKMKSTPGIPQPSPTKFNLPKSNAVTSLDVASSQFKVIKDNQAFILPQDVKDRLTVLTSKLDRYYQDYLIENGTFRLSRCLRLHDEMIYLNDFVRLALPKRYQKRIPKISHKRII